MSGTIVLGIGNTLWGDDGFGIAAAAKLGADPRLADHVTVVDGGTQGLYLLPIVQDATDLLVLDTVDFGAAPGSLKILRNDEIPRFFGRRPLSLHQTGFADVLFAAELTGMCPQRITFIGAQYEDLDAWGGSLTPALTAAIDVVVDAAFAELASWQAPSIKEVPRCPKPILPI